MLILGATLLVAAALRSTAAGAIFAVFVVTALVREPVVTLPFLPTLFLGAIATLFLGAWARGFLDVSARGNFLPELAPLAVSIALGGFILWFAALAFPLYVGGHYGFHTDIAEEIWQGRFLHYYLPYPGSMLSRQPQWGHLIIPHSCLFHTVAAPFAALPRLWFHLVTKLVLASLLFGISLATALVATRAASSDAAGAGGSGRAAAYAALASVFVPTGFQLLGLGHLMTLFGTWASTLALGFIVIHIDALRERAVFAWTLALISLCFVSYTGSLLFASLTLVAACVVLYGRHPQLAKRLSSLMVIAWGVSFLLYYIHWTLPFVRDSLPALLSGSGSDTGIDVLARVSAQPRKLAYTFGSPLVPLIGLVGLSLARGERRVLLGSWGGILLAFSALDVLFNFLLKHHYFTYPVVAVGIGLGLSWLHEKGWLGRAITALFVVSLIWMGLQEAVAVARGV